MGLSVLFYDNDIVLLYNSCDNLQHLSFRSESLHYPSLINPETRSLKVYKRTKKNREGRVRKTQLFTVTNEGQCMGRVYDQRRSKTKYIKNGCKFPLGFWKKSETRTFSVTDAGRSRTVELKILKLGKKPTDCVKYNWKLFDTSGNKLADNDYKFCNNRAMTSLKIRKIQ